MLKEIESWRILERVLKQSWLMLQEGVTDDQHPFHVPVLGTTNPENSSRTRLVILRQVDSATREVVCHTDARSSKVVDIRHNDRVSWLFYHTDYRVQIRLSGRATIHTADEIAEQHWSETPLTSRRLYCTVEEPGQPVATPESTFPDHLVDRAPTEAESQAGRPYFAVIRCQVDMMEWLFLRFEGHRRARFRWREDELAATWLAP